MLHRLASILILATVAAVSPAFAQAGKSPDQFEALRKRLRAQKAMPMAFYIAKGAPHSCGEGCDTWIAAEGPFDGDAAERLSRFLEARPGVAKLPIFFHSPGGSVTQALAMGRQLRHEGMTGGVARTIPKACDPAAKRDAACETLKRSGQELEAELRFTAASCVSACTYALIGASVRELAPEINLGVHSAFVYRLRADGEVIAPAPGQLEELNEEVRRYLVEMGIDSGLLVVTLETRNEDMRYLTRDEIVRYRIDPRTMIESRWSVNASGIAPVVTKTMFEQRDHGPRQYRWSDLRLSCEFEQGVKIAYSRVLSAAEENAGSTVSMAFGDDSFDFPERKADKASTLTQSIVVPLARLEAAAARPHAEITVTFLPQDAESWPAITKISTAGLADALRQIRSRCEPRSAALQ